MGHCDTTVNFHNALFGVRNEIVEAVCPIMGGTLGPPPFGSGACPDDNASPDVTCRWPLQP